ncbi:MAG: adenine phosphoribosyltransferase [Helicobacteraceae bacterium]|jgi:adenine phosphoribosyltransferase|nr:adenine phosphoribosyltransferase [Helicobacteraceae bacterium]
MAISEEQKALLLNSIRNVPNFPKEGVQFKDITTLAGNAKAFKTVIDHFADRYKDAKIDFVVGAESRGFIFGAPLAIALGVGFAPIRKPGKLPYTTASEKYSLEYGFDEVQIHIDAFSAIKNARALFIDDLIATGGTAEASIRLIERVGAKCVEAAFVINLFDLKGAEKIKKLTNFYSILDMEGD